MASQALPFRHEHEIEHEEGDGQVEPDQGDGPDGGEGAAPDTADDRLAELDEFRPDRVPGDRERLQPGEERILHQVGDHVLRLPHDKREQP